LTQQRAPRDSNSEGGSRTFPAPGRHEGSEGDLHVPIGKGPIVVSAWPPVRPVDTMREGTKRRALMSE